MDDLRLEKLIDETLSTIDPVEIPKDLHFDAAKIMRLARMEEEAEAEAQREEKRASLPVLSRLRDVFQSRSWTRYAAAAAAFAVLLGVYGFSQSGEGNSILPGGSDPTHIADTEIGDNEIPLAEPDLPDIHDDPVTDPQTEIPPEQTPADDPAPGVTPQQPVPPAESTKPPANDPAPPVQEEPSPSQVVEEEPGDVDDPTQYAGGIEADPEEPGTDPEEPGETDPPQEDILGSLLALALQNESFAESFAAEDLGYGYKLLKAEDVTDGTQFMVYFYESEEEAAAQTVNEENIRSILWKRESL